ncbi:hypothetical protein FRC17_008768 [Serendipita sp. 399]|nr:hypothetical protein FRC17_008768 [Serendipita sp. 399]
MSSNLRADERQQGPRQGSTPDAHQAASANQASPRGTNLPSAGLDADSLNQRGSTIGARYDQPALAPSTVGGSSFQRSHTHTTVYSGRTYDSENAQGVRPREDNDDMSSVYSYVSTRGLREFVKEMHGRDKQHSIVTIAMGGLYPCREAVEAILSPVDGVEKKILDLGMSPIPISASIKNRYLSFYTPGCGTGSWAIDMAHRFPHCTVLGVDLAPTPMDQATFPPNLSFEIDDINLGLVHFRDSFDLIHMRCVSGGINNLRKSLEEIQACLKPGGILVVIDGDYRLCKDMDTIYPVAKLPGDADVCGVSEDGSWMSRVMWEAHEACTIAGSNIALAVDVLDRGLWDYPLLDPKTVVGGHFFCPLGSWATADDPIQSQTLQYVGILMRQNFLNLHRAYHAILRKHGMQQNVLDEWARMTDEELIKGKRKVWARFTFSCAQRRAGSNLSAPALPASSTPSEPVIDSSQPPFATYQEWHTQERALAERERRLRMYGDRPRAAVRAAYANMNHSTQS